MSLQLKDLHVNDEFTCDETDRVYKLLPSDDTVFMQSDKLTAVSVKTGERRTLAGGTYVKLVNHAG